MSRPSYSLSISTKRRKILARANAHIKSIEKDFTTATSKSDADPQQNISCVQTFDQHKSNNATIICDIPSACPSQFIDSSQVDNHEAVSTSSANYLDSGDFTPDIDKSESSCHEQDKCSDSEDISIETGLSDQLASWAVKFNISLSATNALLSILHPSHPNLPLDGRTLLKTPQKYLVKDIEGGQYYHFGFINSLTAALKTITFSFSDSLRLSIQVNIDGLPLFKSSLVQFWPILCRVSQPFSTEPFVVGLFCGEKKPSNVHEYLNDFVQEMQLLQAQAGHVTIEGFGNITIHVSCFVCDAPARAYIKQIKGHGGYYGCEKCKQKGKWYGRVVYPDVNASKRTDREFHLQTDKEHHQGFSPLGALNINMVTQFPLDYMHMVCLGVMKRMLLYWVKSPVNKGIRFGHQTKSEISRYLLRIRKFIPREFSRKPRSLLELDRWKATEFRLFLLYVGVVALKSNVVQKVYKHFLLFSVAIYCLASPEFCVTHADWAHEQLKLFILKAEEVFGKDFIVYNVHGLLHLAEDVKNFGPLDTFSAFPFENFLGQLKRLIRKPNDPLSQAIRRLSEKKNLQHKTEMKKKTLLQMHSCGPVPPDATDILQFKQVNYNNLFFSTSEGDNCIGVDNDHALIHNILSNKESTVIKIVVQKFTNKSDFFTTPCSSSLFGICKYSGLTDTFEVVDLEDIKSKCIVLPYKANHVIIPMIN